MEGGGEGVVAFVAALPNAGLSVVVASEGRRAHRPDAPLGVRRLDDKVSQTTSTLISGSHKYVNYARLALDDGFMANYREAHCSKAPPCLVEYPQRIDRRTNLHCRHHSAADARLSLEAYSNDLMCQAPVRESHVRDTLWPGETQQSQGTDAFAESLRKYPERSNSADLIQRILAYTQSKNLTKSSYHSKSMRSLLHHHDSNKCSYVRRSSKTVQTYTRTRHESPTRDTGPNTNDIRFNYDRKVKMMQARRCDGLKVKDSQVDTCRDYLRGQARPLSRSMEVRYLSDVTRYVRDTIRQMCDEQGVTCPGMASRYTEHRKECTAHCSVKHSSNESTGSKNRTKLCQTTSPMASRATSCTRDESLLSPSLSTCQSQLKLCVYCNQPPPCACPTPTTAQRIPSKRLFHTDHFTSPSPSNFTLKEISPEPTCPQDEPCPCLSEQDEDFNNKIREIVLEWAKDVPVSVDYSFSDKVKRQIMSNSLADRLIELRVDEKFEEKAKEEILNCLRELPMWSPVGEGEQRSFKDKLADDLLKLLRGVRKEFDKIEMEVTKWMDGLNFTERVDRDILRNDLIKRLRYIANGRQLTDKDLRKDLVDATRDILKELPLDIKESKSVICNQLADKLVDAILMPNEEIPGQEEFVQCIRKCLKDEAEYGSLDTSDEERTVKDLALALKNICLEATKIDDIQPKMRDTISIWLATNLGDRFCREPQQDYIDEDFRRQTYNWLNRVLKFSGKKTENDELIETITRSAIKLHSKGEDDAEIIRQILDTLKGHTDPTAVTEMAQDLRNILMDARRRKRARERDESSSEEEVHDDLVKEILSWLSGEIPEFKEAYKNEKDSKRTPKEKQRASHKKKQIKSEDNYEYNEEVRNPQANNEITDKIMNCINNLLHYKSNDDIVLDWLKNIHEISGDQPNKKSVKHLAKKLKEIQSNSVSDDTRKIDLQEAIGHWLTNKFNKKSATLSNRTKAELTNKLTNALESNQKQSKAHEEILPSLSLRDIECKEIKKEILAVLGNIPELNGIEETANNEMIEKLSKKYQKIKSKGGDSNSQKEELNNAANEWLEDMYEKRNVKFDPKVKEKVLENLKDALEHCVSKRDHRTAIEAINVEFLDRPEVLDWFNKIPKLPGGNQTKKEKVELLKAIQKVLSKGADAVEDVIVNWLEEVSEKKGIALDDRVKKELAKHLRSKIIEEQRHQSVTQKESSDDTEYKPNFEKKLEWIKNIPQLAGSEAENQKLTKDLVKEIKKIKTNSSDNEELKDGIKKWLTEKLEKLGASLNKREQDLLVNKLATSEARSRQKSQSADDKVVSPRAKCKDELMDDSKISLTEIIKDNEEEIQKWIDKIPKLAGVSSKDMEKLAKKLQTFQYEGDSDITRNKLKNQLKAWLEDVVETNGDHLDEDIKDKFAKKLLNNMKNKDRQNRNRSMSKESIKDSYLEDEKDVIKSWIHNIPEVFEVGANKINKLAKRLEKIRSGNGNGVKVNRLLKDEVNDFLEYIVDDQGVELDDRTKNNLVKKLVSNLNRKLKTEIQNPNKHDKISDESEDDKQATQNWVDEIPKLAGVSGKEMEKLAKKLQNIRLEGEDNQVAKKKLREELKDWLENVVEVKGEHLDEDTKGDFAKTLLNNMDVKRQRKNLLNQKSKYNDQLSEKTGTELPNKSSSTYQIGNSKNDKRKIQDWFENVPGLDKSEKKQKLVDTLERNVQKIKSRLGRRSKIKTEIEKEVNDWLDVLYPDEESKLDSSTKIELANKLVSTLDERYELRSKKDESTSPKETKLLMSHGSSPSKSGLDKNVIPIRLTSNEPDDVEQIMELLRDNPELLHTKQSENRKNVLKLANKLNDIRSIGKGNRETKKLLENEIKDWLGSLTEKNGININANTKVKLTEKLINKLENTERRRKILPDEHKSNDAHSSKRKPTSIEKSKEQDVEDWFQNISELSNGDQAETQKMLDKLMKTVLEVQSTDDDQDNKKNELQEEVQNWLRETAQKKGVKLSIRERENVANKLVDSLDKTTKRIAKDKTEKILDKMTKVPELADIRDQTVIDKLIKDIVKIELKGGNPEILQKEMLENVIAKLNDIVENKKIKLTFERKEQIAQELLNDTTPTYESPLTNSKGTSPNELRQDTTHSYISPGTSKFETKKLVMKMKDQTTFTSDYEDNTVNDNFKGKERKRWKNKSLNVDTTDIESNKSSKGETTRSGTGSSSIPNGYVSTTSKSKRQSKDQKPKKKGEGSKTKNPTNIKDLRQLIMGSEENYEIDALRAQKKSPMFGKRISFLADPSKYLKKLQSKGRSEGNKPYQNVYSDIQYMPSESSMSWAKARSESAAKKQKPSKSETKKHRAKNIHKKRNQYTHKMPENNYLDDKDNETKSKKKSATQHVENNDDVLKRQKSAAISVSKKITKAAKTRISGIIAKNINKIRDNETADAKAKIMTILDEEVGLPHNEKETLADTIIRRAKRKRWEKYSFEEEEEEEQEESEQDNESGKESGIDSEEEITQYQDETSSRTNVKYSQEFDPIRELVRGVLDDYDEVDENRNAIEDHITGILKDQLKRGKLNNQTKDNVLSILQDEDIDDDQAEEISNRIVRGALSRGGPSNASGLLKLTQSQNLGFLKNADRVIRDFCTDMIGPLTPEETQIIDKIISGQVEKLKDILNDSELTSQQKKDAMKNVLKQFIRTLSTESNMNEEELAGVLMDRLQNVKFMASTPRGSQTDDITLNTDESTISTIPGDKTGDKSYLEQVKDAVQNWTGSIRSMQDPNLRETIASEIAGDVLERQKYLQLNPDLKPSNEEELDHLQYEMFRRLNKVQSGYDLACSMTVMDKLMNDVRRISVPQLAKPGVRFDSSSSDPIADVISTWVENTRPDLLMFNDKINQKPLVEDLSSKIRKHIGTPNVDDEIANEINQWLPKMYKDIDKGQMNAMREALKNVLNAKGLINYIPFDEEKVKETTLNWLKQLPLYQKRPSLERSEQENVVPQLVKGLYRILAMAHYHPKAYIDQMMIEETKNHLKDIIKEPELKNDDVFLNKTVANLLDYLNGKKALSNASGAIPDEAIAVTVGAWIDSLSPTKTLEGQSLFDSIKRPFINRLKQIRQQYHSSTPDQEQKLKEEVRKFIIASPLDNVQKENECYITEKVEELLKYLLGVPISYSQDEEAISKGFKNSADLLYEYVVNWCQSLPIDNGTTPEEIEQKNTLKQNITSKLINKIGELNMNPETFNDDILYEDLLLDEVDNLLQSVAMNADLEKCLPALKMDLVSKVKDARQMLRSELAGQIYKQQLRDAVTKTTCVPEILTTEEQASFEILKDNLADAFINLRYIADDEQDRDKFSKKINNEVNKFCREYLLHHPMQHLDRKHLKQDLFNALNSVPVPNDESMKSEVEQSRIKDIINDWTNELPYRENLTPSEQLHRHKMASVLAKRLHETEKVKETNVNADVSNKLLEETSKWLKKQPLKPGAEIHMPEMANALTQLLESTEFSRRFDASSREVCPMGTTSGYCLGGLPPCTLSSDDRAHMQRIRDRVRPRSSCYRRAGPRPVNSQTVKPHCYGRNADVMTKSICPGVMQTGSEMICPSLTRVPRTSQAAIPGVACQVYRPSVCPGMTQTALESGFICTRKDSVAQVGRPGISRISTRSEICPGIAQTSASGMVCPNTAQASKRSRMCGPSLSIPRTRPGISQTSPMQEPGLTSHGGMQTTSAKDPATYPGLKPNPSKSPGYVSILQHRDAMTTTPTPSPYEISPHVIVKEYAWDSVDSSRPQESSPEAYTIPPRQSQPYSMQHPPMTQSSSFQRPTFQPAYIPQPSYSKANTTACEWPPNPLEHSTPPPTLPKVNIRPQGKSPDISSCEDNTDGQNWSYKPRLTHNRSSEGMRTRPRPSGRPRTAKPESRHGGDESELLQFPEDTEFWDTSSGRRIFNMSHRPFTRERARKEEKAICRCKERVLTTCKGRQTRSYQES